MTDQGTGGLFITRMAVSLNFTNFASSKKETEAVPSLSALWQEGAGVFLLLAALHPTGLQDSLLATVQTCLAQAGRSGTPFNHSQPTTLLFLPVVGLPKPFIYALIPIRG
jgi:hypothetical protein